VAFITIPFAVWGRTAWISERTFGAVIASGLKLTFLYTLASASIPVLSQYVAPLHPTQQDCLFMLATGVLLLFLQVGAHKLAGGLMHGMPSFTHTDVVPRLAPVVSIASAGITLGATGLAAAGGMIGSMISHQRDPQLQLPLRRRR
jgi:type IV secretion system protein TrbL